MPLSSALPNLSGTGVVIDTIRSEEPDLFDGEFEADVRQLMAVLSVKNIGMPRRHRDNLGEGSGL